MEPWEIWVRATWLHGVAFDYPWLWPVAETLHFIGLSLLIGTVGLFDLRVLGMAKAIAPAALHRLVPFGVGGYLLNLVTGTFFFFGFPDQYAYNRSFYFKLAFMGIASVNVLLFYGTAFRNVKALPAGADAALRAKILAAVSLSMWVGVIVAGRLLTFFRPPFFH